MDLEAEISRVVCVDDRCTGILGADNRCGTCGAYAGIPREDAETGTSVGMIQPRDGWTVPVAGTVEEDVGSMEDRVPCHDGLCTGIVGANHRCGTCGKVAEGLGPCDPQ